MRTEGDTRNALGVAVSRRKGKETFWMDESEAGEKYAWKKYFGGRYTNGDLGSE